MAVTLVQTPGAYNANTYVTLANAEIILDAYSSATTAAWDAAVDDNKNRALVQATRQIDSQRLDGVKYYADYTEADGEEFQALHFPLLENELVSDGSLYIPAEVQRATALQAAYILRVGTSSVSAEAAIINGVKRQQIGHYEEEYFQNGGSSSTTAVNQLCYEAKAEISRYILKTIRLVEG